MAKHSYRTATVAVIETLGSNEGDEDGAHHGGMGDMDMGDSGSLQLAPAGVSLTGTKQSSIEVLSAAGASLAVGGQMALAGEEGEGTLHRQESASEEPIEVPHGLIEDEEEVAQGLTGRQKGMLGFIWLEIATFY